MVEGKGAACMFGVRAGFGRTRYVSPDDLQAVEFCAIVLHQFAAMGSSGSQKLQADGKPSLMQAHTPDTRSPLRFFVLVFVLSIPFWLVGAVSGDRIAVIPINLPISSLMACCPLIAAVILTWREEKSRGITQLLRRIFDYRRTVQRRWYLPVVFLMPAIMVVSYGAMRLMGWDIPEPHIPLLTIPIFLLVFFIPAVGEEVGWSGYVIDPMQNRWGALRASIIVGVVWALWHVLPYIQAHHTPAWIAWQCLGSIGSRVIIVRLYNTTGKSVFAATVYHTMINVSVFLFPVYGSHYDPAVTGIFIIITACIVTSHSHVDQRKLDTNGAAVRSVSRTRQGV